MSEHRIDVVVFTGFSPELERAHDEATVKLQAWYAEQAVLFTSSGGSIFQFSTAVCMIDLVNEPSSFIVTITVFDTRYRPG